MKLRNLLIGTGLAALLSDCGSVIPRASEEDLIKYQKTMGTPQEISCLKEREYFLPDDVMGVDVAVDEIIYRQPATPRKIFATYIRRYQQLSDREEELKKRLIGFGYSEKEIEVFYTILSTPGNIYINQNYEGRTLKELLIHERVHKEVSGLSSEEQEQIKSAYEQLKNRNPPVNSAFSMFLEDKPEYGELVKISVYMGGWEEFFPYLAQSALEDYVEETLRQEFPEVHGLFLEVKERAKVECLK